MLKSGPSRPLELDPIPVPCSQLKYGIKPPYLLNGSVVQLLAEPDAVVPDEFICQLAFSVALGRPDLMGYFGSPAKRRKVLVANRLPASVLRYHWRHFRKFHGLQEHALSGWMDHDENVDPDWGDEEQRRILERIKRQRIGFTLLPALEHQSGYSDARAIAQETGCSMVFIGNWRYDRAMSLARNVSTVFELRMVGAREKRRMRFAGGYGLSGDTELNGPLLSLDIQRNKQSYAHPERIIFSAQTEKDSRFGRKKGGANRHNRIVNYKPIARGGHL